jgi:uncharacterized protein
MENVQLAKDIRTAIKQGDVERVEALIGADPSRLNMTTVFGNWLHQAASLGKFEIVKRLVAMGADINAYSGIAGGGPLHRAASDGHYDIVTFLTERGASLDVSEPERNPLFGAIHFGHTEIAKFLIDSGIDTSIKYKGNSMKNMDALAFANEWGRKEIAEYLITRQAPR